MAVQPKLPEGPLFTAAESALLLYVEPPFHDSSPNQTLIQALEASAAARLSLFNQLDQSLLDSQPAKG